MRSRHQFGALPITRKLDSIHADLLPHMAAAVPAEKLLEMICRAFEGEVAGVVTGVTILDRTLQIFEHAVFPQLSPDYAAALHGIAVADKPGSCALAVFDGATVVSEDVASDERFSPLWRELGVRHGLKALVSIPAEADDGRTLGTFVVAWPPGNKLSDAEMQLANDYAQLCGFVLTYRRTQLRQELLIGELQHRVRNLFSTIGAVVYSTLKSHPQPEAFRNTFDGRLMALARAHALALEPGKADLRQLLMETLAPYSVDHQVVIDGPRIMLSEEAAVAFSLAAHELATNAAKYGAFSGDGGTVEIGWDVADQSSGDPLFTLNWSESDGPAVAVPEHQGYGQKTLTRSIASAFDGKVELDYRPSGMSCSISAPYSHRIGVRVN